MQSTLADLLHAYKALPEDQRAQLAKDAATVTRELKWIPNPGPQTDAYYSKADILLFGGQPSGGKSALLCGLAYNCHERSLLLRKQYTDLDGLIDEALKIHGSKDGLNRSPPPALKFGDGKRIDFGAVTRPGDEQHWMGRAHDFLGFDEATQLSLKVIRFLRGWLRTTTPGQRCRTVLATNPPLSADGMWVFDMFAPWLNPQHPNPAKPGELRWFVTDENDVDHEVDGPGTYTFLKDPREAESRTYIPSEVTDNPDIDAKDYGKRLDALPAEIREILMGGFRASFKDQEFQVIPTAWIKAAQDRWTPEPPKGVPMCSMGVDCSGGGTDPMIIAPRYDGWFAKLIKVEGRDIPMERIGAHCAGIVISHRHDNAKVVVDMGGGYGGPLYERLAENIGTKEVFAYKGAEASEKRTRDKRMGFVNKRSEAYWRVREALDPSQEFGSPICFDPDDHELMADLTAPTFEVTPRGYKVEPKEDVTARLGRSTDRGDAVVMAWFDGARKSTHALNWLEHGGKRKGGGIKVDLGPRRR